MNNTLESNIKTIGEETKKQAVASAEKQGIDKSTSVIAADSVDRVLAQQTDYNAKVLTVVNEMSKRIRNSDVDALESELAKMKGQGEARYIETIAKIAKATTEAVESTVKLLEQQGLPVSTGRMLDDLKRGFIVIGNPGLRISIAQLVADAYLIRNIDLFFQVGQAPTEKSMLDFFYQKEGRKSITVRTRPSILKAKSAVTLPIKNVVSVCSTAGGSGLYTFVGQTVEEFKAAVAALAIATLEATYSLDEYGVELVTFKNDHASNALYVEQDTELSLKTTLSLKKFMIGVVGLAATKIHGALGLGVALFGEEAVSKLTKDVQRDLPATILG